MIVAVVDVGTNSTRLLVAEVRDGRVARELERRTNVTRLGEGVDRTGRLSEQAVERVLAACASYREAINEHGAERVVAVLTSAVRDADNGAELERVLREQLRLRGHDDLRGARGAPHLPGRDVGARRTASR